MRSLLFVIPMLAACAVLASALAPCALAQMEVAQGYVHDKWGSADGLPVNTVNAIAQGHDGFLWMATFGGLVRFDGRTFKTFTTANLPGLPSSRLSQLEIDRAGRLWFVAGNEHVGYVEEGEVTVMEGRFEVPLNLVRAADGTVWLAANKQVWQNQSGTLVHRWTSEQATLPVTLYPGADSGVWALGSGDAYLRYINADRIHDVDRTDMGYIVDIYPDPLRSEVTWVAAERGVYRLTGPHGNVTRVLDALSDKGGLHRDAHGRLCTTSASQLSCFLADPAQPASPPQRITLANEAAPTDWRTQWTWLNDSLNHWVAGPRVVLHNDKQVVTLSGPNAFLRDATLDDEGNVWVAINREGLHRISPSLFTTYGAAEGGLSDNIYAIDEAADGSIWMGSQRGGLSVLREGGIENWSDDSGRPTTVLDIHMASDGSVWLAGDDLRHTKQAASPMWVSRREAMYGRQTDPLLQTRAMYEDRQGCLWIGTRGSLFQSCQGQRREFTVADGLSANQVQAFAEAEDGTLWLATMGGGIMAYRAGTFTPVTTKDGLSSDNVRWIHIDGNGTLWLGSVDRGLNRFHPDALWRGEPLDVTVYTTQTGLYSDGIHAILHDGQGRFWMSSNQGLFWVPIDQLEAYASGTVERVFSVSYDERAGLRDREANGGGQSSALKASDGRLWFATQGGAVVVSPSEVQAQSTEVRVYIDEVQAQGQAMPLATPGLITLPKGVRDLEVAYASIHFSRPEAVRYRYRLRGQRDAWTDVDDRTVAVFTNLDPGMHTFEVVASVYPGQWPDHGAAVTVEVPPYLYETRPFRLAAGLAGLLALGGVMGWRSRRQRERVVELNRLVEHRTDALRLETSRSRAAKNDAEAQRVIAEEALRVVSEQAEQLAALDASKSRFFANISHEFRTPLTLTLGPLADLQEGLFGELTDTQQQQVTVAHQNTQRVMRLVNQLLDLSRLEAGAVTLAPEPVNLTQVVGATVDAFGVLADRKGVELLTRWREDHYWVHGDAERLEEIVANLIGNALKFTPAGGQVAVTMRLDGDAETVRVIVADSGIGIAPNELPHVFDRFYQARGGEDVLEPGTGIGLSLVKELVELHSGQVEVESEIGRGSVFTVTFPAGAAADSPAPPRGQPAEQADARYTSHAFLPALADAERSGGQPTDEALPPDVTTVLVVDDHPDIRAYIRRHLETRYATLEAGDGEQALAAIRQHMPDLVISDVMMPRLDGFELMAAVRADPELAFIPFIFLTGRAGRTDKMEGLGRGADDYLVKPVDRHELIVRVRNLLEQRQRLRQLWQQPGRKRTPAEGAPPASASSPFVNQLRATVMRHLGDTAFSVEALADAMALSRSQLHRRVRQEAGETPVVFIRHVRLDEAARQLVARTGSVSEIGYGVGFNSMAHFSRAFKGRFGTPPSAFKAGQERRGGRI
ncbi:MAG: two-component regulator propeller domain-containing protein [Bacteroidota bacterium]